MVDYRWCRVGAVSDGLLVVLVDCRLWTLVVSVAHVGGGVRWWIVAGGGLSEVSVVSMALVVSVVSVVDCRLCW